MGSITRGGPADYSPLSGATRAEVDSQALYELLMSPIDPWLAEHNIRDLVLNLHGDLRYVPFAALHDGNEFLAEKYTLSRFVWGEPGSRTSPRFDQGVGFGTTVEFPGFPALRGAASELNKIFTADDGIGAIQGQVLVNDAFDLAAL